MFSSHTIELWGGIECTINRVHDVYHNQLERSAHIDRLTDLDLFASLGIRTLRYPVLWEHIAPEDVASADWSWPDARLQRLREHGITPIIGLVHHGSGPRHTSLVDPAFPEKLACYAAAVARRYPWVEHYTPVNEPLTTARFSGLYGFWHPHGRDANTFWVALSNQCRAIVLSMQAIRAFNPRAQLIQTDDLGKTYSTRRLRYQAKFNNELRWLAWDLLSARVDKKHALWNWLVRGCGARPQDLDWFREHATPPDIVGINYYVSSERLLDERLSHYPPRCHGGNRRHRYADIEAARAINVPTAGAVTLIREAWERYALPIAITEAHMGSSREDQMRWLMEIWRAAEQTKCEGVDIRAVTAWALLGSYDWDCLVTACRDYYEPGAFDLRRTQPRPTALAGLMRDLAAGMTPHHPVLSQPGWWRRDVRFACAPVTPCQFVASATTSTKQRDAPILITGATGTLGQAYSRICQERGLPHRLLARRELDIADASGIERAIEHYEPWAVINTAGYVRVDDAESDPERCFRENTLGPSVLAEVCAKHKLPLVTFSSNLVFDGQQQQPYIETDGVFPLNVYGRSKAEAEVRVLGRHPSSLVIRTSSFFGPWDEYNFITTALRALCNGRPFRAANDLIISPTYVPDLVHASLDLLIDSESGIWHLTNGAEITWADLVLHAAQLAKLDCSPLHACPNAELGLIARRPTYSAMTSRRAQILPTLQHALERYLSQVDIVRELRIANAR